ncbi:helix-turn-helix transcriptional regulator [Pseudomonas oryzihabitans]|uniref:helix-turn-helix transcriptional regulator n=1 Tax=Pseudomonas oryzihabitans TaxID=47885 RepID=UPI002557BB98|nr:helix-turn-helix transcriptional regulator [Pseudomonas oryzihabitans]MDK8262888.1 helix-turn-helix transcriptional regulator [Pseudomonas oryzihabitans]
MPAARSLERSRIELAEFLRSRRERLTPEEVGLPSGGRRRTPGLRREEVATLARVGLSWYTWLEQGREISVSSTFLDNLSRALKLDATERRHLYLLAQQRPPCEPGRTWCVVPPLIIRLIEDLDARPSYVLNLRWDVLAWNDAADRLFGFSEQIPERRNLLWMLFTSKRLRQLLDPWEGQAVQIFSSFRRDFVQGTQDAEIVGLVRDLERVAPEFCDWWNRQDIHGPCQGIRYFRLDGIGQMVFEHTTLTVDVDRHLRLVYYAPQLDGAQNATFERWLKEGEKEAHVTKPSDLAEEYP